MGGSGRAGWEAIAARQCGVLSRAQALGCGLTRHHVGGFLRRGSWAHALPGVYRSTAAPVAWPQALVAASLWAEGAAAVSHQAAAALWGLEGFWRSRVELSSLLKLRAPPGVRLHQVRRLDRADVELRLGARVTSVARTLVDLAGVVPERTLERALDEALRKDLVSVERVQGWLERNGRRGREGVACLEALLGVRARHGTTDSPLETDAWAALRRAGLPGPTPGFEIVAAGRLVAKVDLAWPRRQVAVQVHSAGLHRQRRTWELDQRTENELQAHGWRVVKVTDRMLHEDLPGLIAVLRRVLAARG